jgi:two-component system response regulator HydG
MMFARHFLGMTNKELNKSIKGFSPEVEEIFNSYVWYGNLRELKNVIKRAALLTDGEWIEDRALPFEITNFGKLLFEKLPSTPSIIQMQAVKAEVPESRSMLNETTLKGVSIDAEYEMILEALKQTNFNKSKAARFLHIDRKTLYNKMKQYQQLNNHRTA